RGRFLHAGTDPASGASPGPPARGFGPGRPSSFPRARGGPPVPLISNGSPLPTGVTFTDNGDGTATLAGTAAATTDGTYQLTLTATNAVGSAIQTFTLTVVDSATPTFTSAAAATFNVGAVGSFAVTTVAFPAVTSITRDAAPLPAGVTFVDDGNGTATLSGTPAPGSAGVYSFGLTASNGVGVSTQNFTLTVGGVSGGAPTITSANVTTFVVGTPGTFRI